MDWTKLLQIRVRDKLKFTLSVFSVVITALLGVFLINYFVFGEKLSLLGFFKLTLPSQDKALFAPEAIFLAVFVLLILWILAIALPPVIYSLFYLVDHFPFFEITKEFIPDDCLNNLIFQGKVEKTGSQGFRITNSDSGVLIKHRYWKNFSTTFKFNFEKLKKSLEVDYIKEKGDLYTQKVHKPLNNYFGFIFRALDLDNYFMVSVGIKDIVDPDVPPNTKGDLSYTRKLLITPHIRVDGKWEVFIPMEYSNRRRARLKENVEHLITIEVKENKLEMIFEEINGDPFIWRLPTNFRTSEPDKKKEIKGEEYSFGDESIIPFRESYGRIGFRAYGEEHVIIKEIKVTRL